MRYLIYFVCVSFLLINDLWAARLLNFFPDHKEVDANLSQVRATFSDEMIKFGTAAFHPDPFKIKCVFAAGSGATGAAGVASAAPPYSTRWLDTKVWVLDFRVRLQSGSECTFIVDSTFKDVKGKGIEVKKGKKSYTFSSAGPSLLRHYPHEYHDISERDQHFILVSDIPLDLTDVTLFRKIYLVQEGISERVPVVEVTGEERQKILSAAAESDDLKFILEEVGPQEQTSRVFIVKAQRELLPGISTALIWGRGIRAKNKIASRRDQRLNYTVRKKFSAEMTCLRDNALADCNPLGRITLAFSAPIRREDAVAIGMRVNSTIRESGKKIEGRGDNEDKDAEVNSIKFLPPFAEMASLEIELPAKLKDIYGRELSNQGAFPLAFKTSRYSPLLKFAAPFGIMETSAFLPVSLRKVEKDLLAEDMSLLQGESITVSGLTGLTGLSGEELAKKVIYWIRATIQKEQSYLCYQTASKGEPKTVDLRAFSLLAPPLQKFTLPVDQNRDYEYQTVGIPLKGVGLHVVEMQSKILGSSLVEKDRTMYVAASSLVTNLSIHLKRSDQQQRSLIWVTSLDQGKPVANAKVSINDCEGKVLWTGTTDEKGVAFIDAYPQNSTSCPFFWDKNFSGQLANVCPQKYYDEYANGEFIFATHKGDFTFVHTSWDKGIESWRYNLDYLGNNNYYENNENFGRVFHTVLDRRLLRRGEVLSMAHFLRRQGTGDLELLSVKERPSEARLRHQGSEKEYVVRLDWDAQGGVKALSSWN
ncbi:MAG: hypothetical protein HQK53_05120, partial [Oligoflexia bacterium]|nr:hypothetical protein [Oligoflexia bacterium]